MTEIPKNPIEVSDPKLSIEKPKFKRTQVIPDSIAELLVAQISRELINHNRYATFASYYNCQGLDKLEDYYSARAKEEYNHHNWIREYLNSTNVPFSYPIVEAVELSIENNLSPLEQTVNFEIETTEWINKITKAALEAGDYQTFYWMKRLVDEQTEEEKLSIDVYNIGSEDTDWLTKQDSIYDLYFDDED